MSRRTIWTTILVVVAFTAFYVYYVQQERKESIRKFSSNPRIGDIYKMRMKDWGKGDIVFYLKVNDIDSGRIYFYRSKLILGGLHDSFLKQFDKSQTQVFTKNELAEIIAGEWKNAARQYMELVEIERK